MSTTVSWRPRGRSPLTLGESPAPTDVDWVALGRAGTWLDLDPPVGLGTRIVRGTGLSAAVVQARLDEGGLTYSDLADVLAVDRAAIREADWYASRHGELAYAELRGDTEAMAELRSRPAL